MCSGWFCRLGLTQSLLMRQNQSFTDVSDKLSLCLFQVYIVLKGENSVSQTREIHVPGCTLFKRNSQDTFILRCSLRC